MNPSHLSPHRFWYPRGSSAETTFQMRSGLLVLTAPPLHLPQCSSSFLFDILLSCVSHTYFIEDSARGEWQWVQARHINKSKQIGSGVVRFYTELVLLWLFSFSFCLHWNFTQPFIYVCFMTLEHINLAKKNSESCNQVETSTQSWKTHLLQRGPVTGRKPGIIWERLITSWEGKHLRAPRTTGKSIHLWRDGL